MIRMTLLALLLCLPACGGKAARVSMRLDPGWQSVVLVEGSAPTVRVVNNGDAVVEVAVAPVNASGGHRALLERYGGAYEADLPGPARFTIKHKEGERTHVELRAVGYRQVVVDESPGMPDQLGRPEGVFVRLETSLGEIVLELDEARAPISTANFLRYVDEGAYDGTIFHRVVPGFVVQGGGHLPDLTEIEVHAPIINEWGNGLDNERGTIGMARETEPDSANVQWYVNVSDNERLDIARDVSGGAGYAVFGRVAAGMEVIDAIEAVETHAPPNSVLEDVPVEPVVLIRAARIPPE